MSAVTTICLDSETLVLDHLGLAHRCARAFKGRGVEDDDLEQVARLALVKAARGYDADRGAFAPFAAATIRGELKRHFRDRAWGVRPPRRLQELQARIRTEHPSDITSANAQAVADKMQVDVASVREAAAARGCYSPDSIDAALDLGHELAQDERGFNQVDAALTVAALCSGLTTEERKILIWRYVEECSQQQIADRIGISQMQVSRRISRLLAELRETAQPSLAA